MSEETSGKQSSPGDEVEPSRPVILIVDDDPDDIHMCQLAFRRAKLDVDVRVAQTARAGVDWLTGNTPFNNRQLFPVPDIVISDFKTPDHGGLHLLGWVRKSVAYAKMPVIIHSGLLQPGDSSVSMKLGATACIQKEACCRELIDAVKQALAAL